MSGDVTACDALVIGAGIAGASVAYELAAEFRVVVIEREDQPGYHATGRSAAVFTETYGPAEIRALARASRAFLERPPAGFAEVPLVRPRGVMRVARADQHEALRRAGEQAGPTLLPLDAVEAGAVNPLIAADYAAAALYEAAARDIDVHALHQGYLKGLRGRGGALLCGAGLRRLTRTGGVWRAETPAGSFVSPLIVNAAGAWADEVAELAGLRRLGLQPRRRTVVLLDLPEVPRAAGAPMTVDVDETFYFKPDAGRLLASPADDTPVPPSDVRPEEEDVALAVDRVATATGSSFARVHARWAGLRTCAPDALPVIGFGAEGFFWLAGQGGYGIMTAPALARAAAALAAGEGLPADLRAAGLTADALSPARFGASA